MNQTLIINLMDDKNAFRNLFNFANPNITKLLRLKAIDHDENKFLIILVQNNVGNHQNNQITRNDFLQHLMKLRDGIEVKLDAQ